MERFRGFEFEHWKDILECWYKEAEHAIPKSDTIGQAEIQANVAIHRILARMLVGKLDRNSLS